MGRRLAVLGAVLLGLIPMSCGDSEGAADTTSSSPATTRSTTATGEAVEDTQPSVEEVIGLVSEFDQARTSGSTPEAVAAGNRAGEACVRLANEIAAGLPDDAASPGPDIALHCAMLSAAVIGLEKGETLPREVDDIGRRIQQSWDEYLTTPK